MGNLVLKSLQKNVDGRDWKSQNYGVDGPSVSGLIARIESGELPSEEYDMRIDSVDVSHASFSCEDLYEFMKHIMIMNKADLKYPVIVNKEGNIIDGRHRLCKAILEGKRKIKAIRLLSY